MGEADEGLAGGGNFADRLIGAVEKKGNPLCVGIDPRFERLPKAMQEAELNRGGDPLVAAAEAVGKFARETIEAVADVAPVVKIQMAFFEIFGAPGLRVLEDITFFAEESGLIVIGDGKRNDIGSTAEAYAAGYLGEFDVGPHRVGAYALDALTVNAYLGTDGIAPFLKVCDGFDKGIYVLVKTSNPSSGELQDLEAEGSPVYEKMAGLVAGWGESRVGEKGYASVGAVVGATYPEQGARLRELLPRTPFLLPGYGAQGGKAEDLKALFGSDGLGAVVNSSRGVIFAYEREPYKSRFGEGHWQEAVEAAARDAADELAAVAGL
ncbi:MAG: orotidine-5'-phosphate decarboxylase [Planctomycetota bacterium]|jgi:orotidine-5'-phosphate decarboxylase